MADIIPAILPASYKDLKEKLALAATAHVEHVHVDITDGSLTEKSNWPYNGSDSEWDRLRREDLNFEAHLMVKDPEVVYEDWIRAGAERLIFQYESFPDDESLTNFLLKVAEHFGGDNAHLKVEIGLALNLDTSIEKILPHVLECDFVQLMSIRQIGSQGQEFQEEIFDKIRALRSEYPETIVSVDGGVSADNAVRLIEAGADRLCIGSAIFAAEDPLEAIDVLLDITE
jgi:ribulose-phosphate 3-epimerase